MTTQKTREDRRPIQETPVQEIQEIKDRCPAVNLRIMKRTADGRIATIAPSLNFDTLDLLNGKLEAFLDAKTGGGEYTIEVRDPATMDWALPRPFKVFLLGPPKDPRHVSDAHIQNVMQGHTIYGGQATAAPPYAAPVQFGGGYGYGPPIPVPQAAYNTPGIAIPQPQGPGQFSLPPDGTIPPWGRSYAPEHQWKLYYDAMAQSGRLPAGASLHSDHLANTHAQQWQTQWAGSNAENAKLREKVENIEKERREVEARYQKQVEDLRVQGEREKLNGEMAALRSELASIRDGGGNGNGRRNGVDWGVVLTGLVPLAVPLVQLIMKRSELDSHMSIEMRKLESKHQESTMLALMKPKDTTDWPALLASLATFVVPLASKMFDNNSPQMQAELIEMRNNSTMMQMKMFSDMIREYESEPEKPAWWPLAEGLLRTFDRVGMQIAAKQGAAQPNGGPAQQQPRPPLPDNTTVAQDAQVWQHLHNTHPKAAAQTRHVWEQLPIGQGFHKDEWRVIIFNIHAKTAIDELVPWLIEYLLHCEKYQIMPPVLQNVFTDQSLLEQILKSMPIAEEDPAYVQALFDAIVVQLGKTTVLAPPGAQQPPTPTDDDEDDGDDGDDDDDGEEAPESEQAASA